jgi:hypothetical protein
VLKKLSLIEKLFREKTVRTNVKLPSKNREMEIKRKSSWKIVY